MHASSSLKDTNQGPIMCSHAKQLQKEVNSLLAEINFVIHENVILPPSQFISHSKNLGESKHLKFDQYYRKNLKFDWH